MKIILKIFLLLIALSQVGCLYKATEFVYYDSIHFIFDSTKSSKDDARLVHIFIDFEELDKSNFTESLGIRVENNDSLIILNSQVNLAKLKENLTNLEFIREASSFSMFKNPGSPKYKRKYGDYLIYFSGHKTLVFDMNKNLVAANFWAAGINRITSLSIGDENINLPTSKKGIGDILGKPDSSIRFFTQ
jgi:hypothetical protein